VSTGSNHRIVTRCAEEIAAVVGTLLEKPAAVKPGTTPTQPGYLATISAEEGGQGSLELCFDRTGADALTKRMLNLAVEPAESEVLQSLKEVCSQAAASLIDRQSGGGARLTVWTGKASGAAGPVLTNVEIVVEDEELTLQVGLAGSLEISGEAVEPSGRAAGRHPSLDVILDIDLPLVVRFGRTELPLKTLAGLGPGSVIDLGRSPDDPVEVLVSNQVVARGEVVIVSGHYGVRIREIVAPADRVRSMEVNL
jgi:flagellar motor switch protein FliN/FliY